MSDSGEDALSNAFRNSGAAIDRMRSQAGVIASAYESLPKEMLRQALLVEYRCPNRRGCLLLHCWRGIDGRPYYYVPHYRLSRQRNQERTVESARQKNTLDGDRTWKPRSGDLSDLREWGATIALDLQCDHLDPITASADAILADAAKGRRGAPFRRIVTARFA